MLTTLIFPHQLYKEQPALKKGIPVILVEEDLFFKQYCFNKQKLILHRASMKAYEAFLQNNNYKVNYIETTSVLSDIRKLLGYLAKEGVKEIHYVEVTDDWLSRRLKKEGFKHQLEFCEYPSPNFLNKLVEVDDFFNEKKTYHQTDFYIAQRKQRNILLDNNKKPIGGKWTYDIDNRAKFPKNYSLPIMEYPKQESFVIEAIQYIDKHFPGNYGNNESFIYPVNFNESEKWLADFLKDRLSNFGNYEDAMVAKENFLYHSVLSPILNIGLIKPQQIIDKVIDAAAEYNVPLNSLEGFMRQVIGWREFIRIVYEREGRKQRTKNYWGFTRKIPKPFWTGETGIAPLDIVIKKVLSTGYSHHIERLMVMGNFMLLCEFDPNEVYRWFMEMYVDSYDWVMVPNVYGMTQFADGGLMMTKPYISGSNYLLKMSDFEKGPWQQVWDGLFWRFINIHRGFFIKNPRLGMLVNTFDKMLPEKQETHLKNAENYLKSLDEKNARS